MPIKIVKRVGPVKIVENSQLHEGWSLKMKGDCQCQLNFYSGKFMQGTYNSQDQGSEQQRTQRPTTKGEDQMNFYVDYFELSEDSDHVDLAQASHHYQSVDSISLCEDQHQFEEFCNEFERGDFTFMKTVQKELCKTLRIIVDHIHFFKIELKDILPRFLDLVVFKLKSMPFVNSIYKKIMRMVALLSKKFEYEGSEQKITSGKPITDNLFKHYVEEMYTRDLRKGMYKIEHPNGQILLEDYIDEIDEYKTNPLWQNMFSLASYHLLEQDRLQKKKIKQVQKLRQFSRNIYKIPSVPCNDCHKMKFLYMKRNIFDQEVNKDVISLAGGIEYLEEKESKIVLLKQIVGLFNAEGGVVLWDCKKKYFQVLPTGEILSENDKLNVRKKVRLLLEDISPKVELGVDCSLDFVPVAENPLNKVNEVHPVFREGCYVTVLKVFRRRINPQAYSSAEEVNSFVKFVSLLKPVALDSEDEVFRQRTKVGVALQRIFADQSLKEDKGLLKSFNERLKGLQVRKPRLVPLFQIQENDAEVEGFQLCKPTSWVNLRGEYQSLARSLQANIGNISRNMLSEKEAFQKEESRRAFLTIQNSLLLSIEQDLKELEIVLNMYYSDRNHWFAHKEINLHHIESHYANILDYYREKGSALTEWGEVVVDAWKNEYLFSRDETEEVQSLVGKPLTKKKRVLQGLEGDPEKQFEFASLLISDRGDIQTIHKRLLKNDIKCVITSLPNTSKIRGVSNSSVIYHNCRHSQLTSLIRGNKDYFFKGKQIIIGALTRYIKLASRTRANELSFEDFKTYKKCLNEIYKEQILKMWKYIAPNGQIEYFLSTTTWLSTLLLYLILNQYGEKGIMKNPQCIFINDENRNKLIIVYPKSPTAE